MKNTLKKPTPRSNGLRQGFGSQELRGMIKFARMRLPCNTSHRLSLTMSWVAILVTPWLAAGANSQLEILRSDTAALLRHPHRLSGTAAFAEARQYILSRLHSMEVDLLIDQEFPTAQTVVRECEIEVFDAARPNKRRLPLLPMRPNGIIPPSTRESGISGDVLYVGKGTLAEYKRSPEDRIVIMDFNSDRGWLRAFRMGAKAVIFVRTEPVQSWHSHSSQAPANYPRYYYSGPYQDLIGAAPATIRCSERWERASGHNVIAFVRGTDPTFFLEKEETLLLSAPLDSFGEVPRLAPGARGAANCAALLGIVERLLEDRPRRNLLAVFWDNQARGHAGASAFYRSLAPKKSPAFVEKREQSWENENAFVSGLIDSVSESSMAALSRYISSDLRAMLREVADTETSLLRRSLHELRIRGDQESLEIAEKPEIIRQIPLLEARKTAWSDFKRALANNEIAEQHGREFSHARDVVKAKLERRAMELATESRNLQADRELYTLLKEHAVVLHLSLLLGDGSDRWGLLIGGDATNLHSFEDFHGLYGGIQTAFIRALEGLENQGRPLSGFEPYTLDGSLNPPYLFFAGRGFTHSGEVAGRMKIHNVVLATTQEDLALEGTPDDTLENIDLRVVARQAEEIGSLIGALASGDSLSRRSAIKENALFVEPEFTENNRYFGSRALARRPASSIPDWPVEGAIIQIVRHRGDRRDQAGYEFKPASTPAYDNFTLACANVYGAYHYGPFEASRTQAWGLAVGFSQQGLVEFASDYAQRRSVATRLNLYPAYHGGAVLPIQLLPDRAWVMDARSDNKLDPKKSFYRVWDGSLIWYTEDKVKAIKIFGDDSVAGLNLPAPPASVGELIALINEAGIDDFFGDGIGNARHYLPAVSSLRSARDLTRLDRYRIELLRNRDIANASVDRLHGQAGDLLASAELADNPAHAEAEAASAYLTERSVYKDTRKTFKDLVNAVLILLLLTIPFAYMLERLLVGATNIYRQVMGFVAFFSLTFIALFFTHPAFSISATPLVIFLGFAIVLLASLVILIVMQKFEIELKAMQGLATTVHSADVSRVNTIIAAMNMGISTMRRRPVRTALTTITIILLTFTILTFASFGKKLGISKFYRGTSPPYSGVTLHRTSWGELNPEILDLLEGRWGRSTSVAPRYWLNPELRSGSYEPRNPGALAYNSDLSHSVALQGLIGIDERELAHRRDLRRLLNQAKAIPPDAIWLGKVVANRLGLQPGAEVRIGGLSLKLAGILDNSLLLNTFDLDGSSVVPVDLSQQMPDQDQEMEAGESETQSWNHLPVDAVAATSNSVVERLGGTLRIVNLYTENSLESEQIAEELSTLFAIPVTATGEAGVYRHVFGSVIEASGVKDLFFPVLLGGLVIFGTMLGSVSDRQQEIYTFSALGLAPSHVTGLFFAEAMVFATVGGMGGYLISQVVVRILEFVSQFYPIALPEMNFSSLNAVATILIVMLTVLVSAVYPAIKASRSANPGIMRSWRLPAPVGDNLDVVFPFTVSDYDFTGVISFLKEHFDNYRDTSMGVFMARDTSLSHESGTSIGIHSNLALAPFDLGVTEEFELSSARSEISGIDEVKIHIQRLSGQPKDWARLNKVLIDDLRKQFLIWRSLRPEIMEEYRARTLVALNRSQPDSDSEATQ